MEAEWFYMHASEIVGPLTAAQLRQHALAQWIAPDDHVRQGKDGKWVAAAKVKGLFDPPVVETSPEPEPAPIEQVATTPAAPAEAPKLFDCPDCGKLVSRRAEYCPQCGCPINKPEPPPQLSAPAALTSTPARYPALGVLASLYQVVAVLCGLATVGGVVYGITLGDKAPGPSLAVVAGVVVGGVAGVITLFALGEGIWLLMDVEANLRQIRDRLPPQGEPDATV